MAQGNIGNLLQHFVALNSAKHLLNVWGKCDQEVVYVDCFSMAPWEPVDGEQPQGFVGRVNEFERGTASGDLTATTLLTAWRQHYHPNRIPDHPQQRDYPNTAVLLRTAFPNQAWEMRLHEIEDKRTKLEDWANLQAPGTYRVEGNWNGSPLISKNPIPSDLAAFVMLDPYQIVRESTSPGQLSRNQIEYLFGMYRLNLISRPSEDDAAPALITLFSFSDPDPIGTDNLVRLGFLNAGWNVEHVRSRPLNNRGSETYHLGWVVSWRLGTQILGQPLQDAWDDWLQ